MSKAQIIGAAGTAIACLLAVVNAFRGMSPEMDAALVFVLFIVLVSSIWTGITTSDERALEKADKQISLSKKLCDPSVLLPERIRLLLSQQLTNEIQNALEIKLGWRKKARRYGSGAALFALFFLLSIPHMAEVLGQFCTIGAHSVPDAVLTHGSLALRANAVTMILLCPISVGAVLWTIFLFPIRQKVMTVVLRSLRETGDFDPVLYVTSSFRSVWSNVYKGL